MLSLLFEGEGHRVIAYASVEECLAGLRVTDPQPGPSCPDLLMIDLHLAHAISGLTVIEQIRANPRLATLPVILMTASASITQQDVQLPHVTLLLKPFDIDETLRLVYELARA